MARHSNKVLGFKIYDKSKEELLNDIFASKKQNIIFNINPLIVANFYNKKDIVKFFNEQKYNIPDGSGILMASKIKKTIPGIELFEDICIRSKNEKIFLYGAKEGIAQKAKENLEKKYKNINIVGVINGYVDQKKALDSILKSKPDILFVALGSPMQENFIINNKKELKDIKIIMPVGGSFDIISGYSKRAPKVWSKLHLEWLYRMIKEPKRIKQNIGLIKYIWLVMFRNGFYNKKNN